MKDKYTRRGFTLTELLVVILIIGILVAVALPMYNHAVLKSKFSSVIMLTKAVSEGQEVYYMTNGAYSANLGELDISIPNATGRTATQSDGTSVSIAESNASRYVLGGKTGFPNHYIMYQKNSRFFPGEIHCEAQKDNNRANWLCEKGLGGELLGNRALTDGYNTYVIAGQGNGYFPKTWTKVSDQVLEPGDSCRANSFGAKTYEEADCYHVTITDGECDAYMGALGCSYSTFNNSVCKGTGGNDCNSSTFNNSTCDGTSGSCSDGIFNNSTCNSRGYGSCRGTFTDSICNADNTASCMSSTFNHTVCYANAWGGCSSSSFKNGSVCYALYSADNCNVSSYDSTSYCAGSYCPNNSPSNVKGKKWYRGSGAEWPVTRPSELVDK